MSSLLRHTLTKVIARTFLGVLCVGAGCPSPAADLFWNTTQTPAGWSDVSVWSLSAGGSQTQTWTNGDVAHFTTNSTLTLNTAPLVAFSGIKVEDGATVVVGLDTDNGSSTVNSYGTGGFIATVDVGAGAILSFGDSNDNKWDNTPGTGYIKTGAGIWSLTGSIPDPNLGDPYGGGFTLDEGTVVMRNNAALGVGPLVINGGTFMTSGGNRTALSSSITVNGDFTVGGTATVPGGDPSATSTLTFGAPVNLAGGNRTINIGNNANNTFSGDISNGALTITASSGATGSILLPVANSYAGGTTINSGRLIANANGALGTGNVTLGGGTLANSTGTVSVSNNIQVSSNSSLASSSGILDITGALIGNSSVTLEILTGAGTVRFADTSDFTGFTGKLKTTTGNATVGGTGTNFDTHTTELSQNAVEVASMGTGGGTDLAQAASRYLRFGRSDNADVAGASLLKIGALSGNGWINPQTGGATPYAATNYEVGHLNQDTEFGGTIIRRATSTFTKVGTGSLTLSGPNYYVGTTVVSDGTLVAGADVSSSTVLITPATMPSGDTITLAGHGLTAGDRVTFGGSPTGLSNTTNYVVHTVVDADNFKVALATAPGTVVAATAASSGMTVTQQSAFGSGNVPVVLGTGGGSTNSVRLLAGTSTAPSVTIERDVNVGNNTGGTTTLGSTVDGNSSFTGSIVLGKGVELTSASVTDANTVTFSGVISGTGAGITKVGAGSVTLSGLNTYTGNTAVEEGTLSITNNNTLANAANVLLSSGVLLDLDFAGTDTINSLFINGNLAASGTWGSLASSAANKSALFDGLGMLNVLVGAAGQMGDFNGDGMVNLADYTVWRDNLGGPESALNGNGSGNATVGSEDYALWKTHFGAGSGSVQALETATVPEPSGVVVLLGLLGAAVVAHRIRVS